MYIFYHFIEKGSYHTYGQKKAEVAIAKTVAQLFYERHFVMTSCGITGKHTDPDIVTMQA